MLLTCSPYNIRKAGVMVGVRLTSNRTLLALLHVHIPRAIAARSQKKKKKKKNRKKLSSVIYILFNQ